MPFAGKMKINQSQLPSYMLASDLEQSWKPGGGRKFGCMLCGGKIRMCGVCHACYRRAMTEEGFAIESGMRICLFDGCEMPQANYSLCYGHYNQLRKGSTLHPIKRAWGTSTPLLRCLYPGCESASLDYSARICKTHRRPVWKYGLEIGALEAMYAIGQCRVCGSSDRLHIDHDHSCCDSLNSQTGVACGSCVRGLLCIGCNTALGMVKDNPQTLRALADYLDSGFRL